MLNATTILKSGSATAAAKGRGLSTSNTMLAMQDLAERGLDYGHSSGIDVSHAGTLWASLDYSNEF